MLELPHIRYLWLVREVYRHRRIGVAATKVHLSQPAATQSLARVEELLNVQLFERESRGMVPTQAGLIFEKRLIRILEHLQRGDKLARRKAARRSGDDPNKAFYRNCSPVQIRALLAVAKAGSFNQAAKDLGVSQPGVHRATRDLAAMSGITLFDQVRGGIVLTPAAESFVHQVRLALSELQQAVYEITEFMGRAVTRINVGSLPLSRVSILPTAIDELLREAGSGVQVNCVDARYPSLLRDLRFGDLDFLIGALRFPKPAADIEQEELFNDDLAIVTAVDHPLAQKKDVTIKDTTDYPWVALPKDTPTGKYLFDMLRIHEQAESPVRIVSSSLVLLRGLLACGDYVSIASTRQIAVEEQQGQLVRLPIALPESHRPIGLTFRKGWTPTSVQRRFLDIVREKSRD